MSRARIRSVIAALTALLVIGGASAAHAAETGDHHSTDSALANDFSGVDRNTSWQPTGKVKLNFPSFHTEGIAFTPDHIFLSAVQILEPTVKYPTPQGGYDRTPGKGIGHVFVMDRGGNLQKDITLGEGDMYHPGGIDFDGTNVWVSMDIRNCPQADTRTARSWSTSTARWRTRICP